MIRGDSFNHAARKASLSGFFAALAALLSGLFAAPATAGEVATANGTAQAVVVAPLTLVSNRGMSFGRLAAGTAAGTVSLNADTSACTVTGPLLHVGGCTSAEFTGMGARRMLVRIQLPTTMILSGPAGASMTVSGFTLDTTPDLGLRAGNGNGNGNGNGGGPPNPRYEILPSTGIFTFRLGGTLQVGANQRSGVYSGTFPVTVQYQ